MATSAFAISDGLKVPDLDAVASTWNVLGAGGSEVLAVESITAKPKASVWRLRRASGGDVIAKRTSADSAAIERLVYEQVIPQIGLDAAAFFGYVEDGDDTWLFIEDVGSEVFIHDDPAQGTSAAAWLAQLHIGASTIAVRHQLPDRGSDHFRRRLDAAVHTLRARLDGQPDAVEREVVAGLLEQCRQLAGLWPDIHAFCARLPRTVVHGDFAALNIRVRGQFDRSIVAFDWEKSGLGVPIIDMVRGLDLEAYHEKTREAWPTLTLDDVEHMALVARVFRPLSHNWARKSPGKLQDHYIHMQQTIEALGRTPSAGGAR